VRFGIAFVMMAACAAPDSPEAFGITMVEDTACVGAGGSIVIGPDGPFCNEGGQ